ncbi:MAG: Ppx/GppA phosphatase family protein [Pseudomonadota bacterium]
MDAGSETRHGPDPALAAAGEAPVAVIDIGSNSVRLVVYDALSRAPFPRFNEKSLCRLGADRAADGSLAEDAVAHALRSVERFHAISQAMGAGRIDVLATEAVRGAPNRDSLIDGIEGRTGLRTKLLAGEEEARLAALGVIAGFHRPHGLVGDIGGGSLEIAEVLGERVGERSASLPLGALPVTALMADGRGSAKKAVDEMLAGALPPLLTEPVFHLVGGGWRALARIELTRRRALCRVAHGFEMSIKEARSLAKEIAAASPEDVAAMPGAPSRRAPTLPAAALVLDRVLKAMKPERVVFSALGLREGWLYSLMPPEERQRDPLIEGARVFGERRARVPAFPAALMRWTDGLFPAETATDRRLREAACALSDMAWRDHANNRAGVAFSRVLELPFVGVSHAERIYLATALLARHGGRPGEREAKQIAALLPEAAIRRAQVLGRALQLGYRFSGSVPAILNRARLEVGADRVIVRVAGGADAVPDGDAVQTRLSALAKALGLAEAHLVFD